MTSNKPKTLDRIDLTILDALQKNGRISNSTLAQRVNLSASPCLERVKRLEQEGYIERYGAFLNASKLNYGMTAFIQVTLDRTTADIFNKFRAQVIEIKEVAECHMVVGGFDYLLKLRFENMEAYRILLGNIVELPGVSQTHTYVVMEHVKRYSGVPIFD
ncbi:MULTISPECIES: winged helix-turn-helix transcriptional regulator [unclassified Colwellia]|uniref:winged helix-turn-helix transcriptional regulator n=1 Tax=unclassified Colwellia TaxID=196834 RepID=UPI0015F5E663|nr:MULTISPECIES: winged helix-turn-helix transcriptional regulator [unclassified Colwellia]MBA6223750.1 winged helix-turn-helix transcriptional regulator [Colwellia sp. MB3u-45]MBA6268480.1 winged helix-turn-helix transcriptional regulator [Colwellia sp. MB3u-43]MBA6288089.1 winged helix-turn-helix transcriptional regulator [Colwellia sp. MB3u-4]MBA6297610.1 winged helix-turn-helix transcriptional regulator [Colwellia sp. MB02u-9]MBA6319931.1 winged helix-turn-helix transcriptional regulator [